MQFASALISRASVWPFRTISGTLLFLAVLGAMGMSLPSPASTTTDPDRDFLLVYTGNTMGELKPCGCAREEDQGGIERRMAYLKDVRQRAKNTLLVDTGDNFHEPTLQGRIKARYLMQALAQMQYDAITLGDKDLIYGNSFLKDFSEIPWVGTNYTVEGLPLAAYRIRKFENGLKAAVLALADPSLFYFGLHGGLNVEDPVATVQRVLADLIPREAPDAVVLLTHMERGKALPFLDIEGVDIVINGNIVSESDVIDMEPVIRGGKAFVQPGPRGQKMGELRVRIGSDGKKSFEQKMVRLDSSVKFDPEMVNLYAKYNEEIESLFFKTLKARRDKNGGAEVYATESACRVCHAPEHEVWSHSRHSHAYETLRKVNKAFDPECLICHVVAFDRPGGFISEADTPDLKNVQCEVCHGPGREHAKQPAPGFGGDARKACQNCHVKNHSPRFKFQNYWAKIKH